MHKHLVGNKVQYALAAVHSSTCSCMLALLLMPPHSNLERNARCKSIIDNVGSYGRIVCFLSHTPPACAVFVSLTLVRCMTVIT